MEAVGCAAVVSGITAAPQQAGIRTGVRLPAPHSPPLLATGRVVALPRSSPHPASCLAAMPASTGRKPAPLWQGLKYPGKEAWAAAATHWKGISGRTGGC